MTTGRLASRAQTTIPRAVRRALRFRQGDEIVYLIEEGRAIMSRAVAEIGADDRFAAFEEWNSNADRKAYAEL
ncbi:MAG: type II toxin-antitoxin system PrlF family antitoxin [Hyphomicrobiales bacterium]